MFDISIMKFLIDFTWISFEMQKKLAYKIGTGCANEAPNIYTFCAWQNHSTDADRVSMCGGTQSRHPWKLNQANVHWSHSVCSERNAPRQPSILARYRRFTCTAQCRQRLNVYLSVCDKRVMRYTVWIVWIEVTKYFMLKNIMLTNYSDAV